MEIFVNQAGEELIKQPVEIKFVFQAVFIVFQHFKNQVLDPAGLRTLKNQMVVVKPQVIKVFRRPLAGKPHPDISPRVILAGAVKGEGVRFDQKTLPRLQMVPLVGHHVIPFSV